MRSLRDIKRVIGQARIESRPQANQTVLRHLLAELAAAQRDAPAPLRLHHARGPLVKAAAALVLLALVLVAHPPQRTTPPLQGSTRSAADLLTVGCLNAACRRGGIEELDRQCEEAARRLDRRPERTSVKELLSEWKGT